MKYQINNTRQLVDAFAEYNGYTRLDFEDFAENLSDYIEYCKGFPGIYLPILRPGRSAFELYSAVTAL